MMKKSVAVLLSTYNGEKYLKAQIESILSQTGVNVKLYIRDDGSVDDTLDILDRYSANTNVCILNSESDENLGPAMSFMKLIDEISGTEEYYAFADQDDVWKKEKLSRAVKMLGSAKRPKLYASNQTLVDSEMNSLGSRYDKRVPTDLFNIIDKNYLAGCTMVMTKALFQKIKDNRQPTELIKSRMHDTWVASVAACIGSIIYDEESYIYYRQHDDNVVGAKESGLGEKIFGKLTSSNKEDYHTVFAKELDDIFGNQATKNSKYYLKLYMDMDTLKGKLGLLLSRGFRRVYYRNKLMFAIKTMVLD